MSINEKTPTCEADRGVSYLALDNDLLSHGEAPHYHRRCIVSLLSSRWGQVVPTLYGRQAILLKSACLIGFALHVSFQFRNAVF